MKTMSKIMRKSFRSPKKLWTTRKSNRDRKARKTKRKFIVISLFKRIRKIKTIFRSKNRKYRIMKNSKFKILNKVRN